MAMMIVMIWEWIYDYFDDTDAHNDKNNEHD